MQEGTPIPFGQLPPEQADVRETWAWIESLQSAQEPHYDPTTGIVTMQPQHFVDLIHRVADGSDLT